jgi:hypothetical protein
MQREWEEVNTGGNCLVHFRDFLCKDGTVRMIGVNEENVCLYAVDFYKYWKTDYEYAGTPEAELLFVEHSDLNNLNSFKDYLDEKQIEEISRKIISEYQANPFTR